MGGAAHARGPTCLWGCPLLPRGAAGRPWASSPPRVLSVALRAALVYTAGSRLICIEPHDQHRRNPAPRKSNPLHPRPNFRESRVKLGNDFSRFHSLTSRYDLTEPHDHSFVFLQTFFCSRVPDKSVRKVPALTKCPVTFLQQERFFLGRKTPFQALQPRGGVFRMRHPGLENRKNFAGTQMMVVRFDTDHTDSGFQKVWSGM